MQEERYGNRDRTYSAWHRRLSTRRFVGLERAQLLAMIDLDAALYVVGCSPLGAPSLGVRFSRPYLDGSHS